MAAIAFAYGLIRTPLPKGRNRGMAIRNIVLTNVAE